MANKKRTHLLVVVLLALSLSNFFAYKDAVQVAENFSYSPSIAPSGVEHKVSILETIKFFQQTTLRTLPCLFRYAEYRIDNMGITHINGLQNCLAPKPSSVPSEINTNFYKLNLNEYQMPIPRSALVAIDKLNPDLLLIAQRNGILSTFELNSNSITSEIDLRVGHTNLNGLFNAGPLNGFNELIGTGVRDILSEGVYPDITLYITFLSIKKGCLYMNLESVRLNIINDKLISYSKRKKIWNNEKDCVSISSSPHINGAGGKIVAYDKTKILITLGDMNLLDRRKLDTTWGNTILVNRKNGNAQMFTTGHRNPSGVVNYDGAHVFEVEQGPQGGDEINLLKKKNDYGWPYSTYGKNYSEDIGSGQYKSAENSHAFGVKPLLAFVPSPAFSSVTLFKKSPPIYWSNSLGKSDLLISSLKASSIYRCRVSEELNSIQYCEKIFLRVRLRDVIALNRLSGHFIYLITDNSTIVSLKISKVR